MTNGECYLCTVSEMSNFLSINPHWVRSLWNKYRIVSLGGLYINSVQNDSTVCESQLVAGIQLWQATVLDRVDEYTYKLQPWFLLTKNLKQGRYIRKRANNQNISKPTLVGCRIRVLIADWDKWLYGRYYYSMSN